jgi:hypothetical protein
VLFYCYNCAAVVTAICVAVVATVAAFETFAGVMTAAVVTKAIHDNAVAAVIAVSAVS